MSGFTHAAVGANAIWITAALGVVDATTVWLAGVGALAALLPDIDAKYAKIHYVLGRVFLPFQGNYRGMFAHRCIFHSLFAAALILLLGLIFLRQFHPLLPLVAAIGYLSHPLIDGFNTTVGLFYPFYRKRVAIVPRFLWTKVGGPVDHALFAGAILSLIFFLLVHFDAIVSDGLTSIV